MARFSDLFLDELRSRNSLEDVVSQYVPLKLKGRRLWGCCPFHNEKTASFSVDSVSQMYYCFGCHKGGTVIQFVMEMERMEFYDAVKYLAERAHMALPENNTRNQEDSFASSQERERIYEANTAAAHIYHDYLWTDEGTEILNYLYRRGLNDRDIRSFGLGAAPKAWDAMVKLLGERGYEPELLKKAGLASERDGKYYDMFRGRAIFPIINAQGRVLGFGGRAMEDQQPKYLNTPDTPVFNKRHGLYGMNFVRNERDVGRLVLVEGYMDTVSLRKHGIRGVVATLGTALTGEQAKLIKRYAPEVFISYDGDSAGQKAALRALDIFDEQDGINAWVLDYPQGKDPDDFVRERGQQGFEALHKYDACAYRMLRAKDDLDMDTLDGMTQYALRCCEILRKVRDPIVMDNHLRTLVNETGYDRDILLRQIRQTQPEPLRKLPRSVEVRRERPSAALLAEYALLTLLTMREIDSSIVKPEDFSSDVTRRAAEWLLQGGSAAGFMESLEDEQARNRIAAAFNYEPMPELPEERMKLAESSMKTIRRSRLETRLGEINEEIKTADLNKKHELYTQIQSITAALDA